MNSVCLRSAIQGSSYDQVLPLPDARRRLGVDAVVRHDRAQQQVLEAALHRGRQPRPKVTNVHSFIHLHLRARLNA